MHTTTLALAALGAAATTVSAHGGVMQYQIDGKWYNGFKSYNTPDGQSTLQRQWATFDPIQDPTSQYMACNNPGAPTAEAPIAPIRAGNKITAFWNTWSHNIGPMVTWMTECPGTDCVGMDPTKADWFKLDQAGLVSGAVQGGKWGVEEMIAQNSSWTSTIPVGLKPGAYLIRHETIAMHSAKVPQYYMQCAQLSVTGSGTDVPAATSRAKIPGVYTKDDPMMSIDVYQNSARTDTNWKVPGPEPIQ
ncbi:lytic polysaccharide monooxygenase [Aulographum hederae CBS 113979]|uniref:AA9 family lytic polysaccharide monooxygenase n=1 Tax=Aulographum hederae CBS 113979 TaxID=1176131 RepID=A0A6G1H8N9_9PEZI|nr:lytic polysaccharide monooxygenase [Aulographum hederae CBS 113979]